MLYFTNQARECLRFVDALLQKTLCIIVWHHAFVPSLPVRINPVPPIPLKDMPTLRTDLWLNLGLSNLFKIGADGLPPLSGPI